MKYQRSTYNFRGNKMTNRIFGGQRPLLLSSMSNEYLVPSGQWWLS
jgi:hypothetical protein